MRWPQNCYGWPHMSALDVNQSVLHPGRNTGFIDSSSLVGDARDLHDRRDSRSPVVGVSPQSDLSLA
jgi:hypothetical protein